MESTVKQRVVEFFKKEEITVNSIYKILGIPQKTLNNQINGESEIGIKTVSAISGLYPKLSAGWLLTGRGEMYEVDQEEKPDEMESLKNKIMMLEEKLKDKDEMIDKLLNRLSPTENVKDEQSSVRSA